MDAIKDRVWSDIYHVKRIWNFFLDTLLACSGVLAITLAIFCFHLYPLIPNISILYLLVILLLSVVRGLYSALLASILAFLAFDFFLVPPLFTLTMYRPEEWVALAVFLFDAILTSSLAVRLRSQVALARKQMHAMALFADEEIRLRQENEQIDVLRRTDALRVSLLSSVSHDLRTPLTVIKASATCLLQQDIVWDDEARLGFASSIAREADRLNHIVGNLLDLSRIEEGMIRPAKERYSLVELACDVLDRLQPALMEREVRTSFPVDLPAIELDYVQIDQVLTNLLENALRYTPAASPIDVVIQSEASSLLVSVADQGPGIPVNEIERVFDKFYRVSRAHALGTAGGSGLGLAICKGLIEAHGGDIWAEPCSTGGVVFRFRLPLASIEGAYV